MIFEKNYSPAYLYISLNILSKKLVYYTLSNKILMNFKNPDKFVSILIFLKK